MSLYSHTAREVSLTKAQPCMPLISTMHGQPFLTHWGRVTHICVGNLTIIGSDNGLSPCRCQAIIWKNVGILLIGPLGTNFSEMLFEIHTFSFKKIHLKMSSGKRRPFCLGLNVLILLRIPVMQYGSTPSEANKYAFTNLGSPIVYSLSLNHAIANNQNYGEYDKNNLRWSKRTSLHYHAQVEMRKYRYYHVYRW